VFLWPCGGRGRARRCPVQLIAFPYPSFGIVGRKARDGWRRLDAMGNSGSASVIALSRFISAYRAQAPGTGKHSNAPEL
jgi:hypothetical protein